MEDGLVQDDDYVGQTGGSEREKKSYLVDEPEQLQISNGDIAESSNVVEVRFFFFFNVFQFFFFDIYVFESWS